MSQVQQEQFSAIVELVLHKSELNNFLGMAKKVSATIALIDYSFQPLGFFCNLHSYLN